MLPPPGGTKERILMAYEPTQQENAFLRKLDVWVKAERITEAARIEAVGIIAGGITVFTNATGDESRFLCQEADKLGFKLLGVQRLRR